MWDILCCLRWSAVEDATISFYSFHIASKSIKEKNLSQVIKTESRIQYGTQLIRKIEMCTVV